MTNVRQGKRASYQWDGQDYAAHSEVQKQWALELMEKLDLQGSERLLDIGCGDGKVTVLLAARLPEGQVVGIDSSEEMIALARQTYSHSRHNLRFFPGDARNLKFREEFDAIFSNAALHWIIDHRPVIRGMYRALKPGGRVLVQMGGQGNGAAVVRAMEQVIDRSQWRPYFDDFTFPYGFYGIDAYSAWLTDAGFTIRDIQLIPKDMVHADRDKFTGWIRTTWLPYLQRVPATARGRFIDEVVTTYLGDTHQGPVRTKMVRLEYLAERPG